MNDFKTKSYITLTNGKKYAYYNLKSLQEKTLTNLDRLPFSIKVLLENLLRGYETKGEKFVKREDVLKVANWQHVAERMEEIPFFPSRVVMQDFTGVPAVVDLASMRDAVKEMGKNAQQINPAIPVDLIIDHSVQVDFYGSRDALEKNMAEEFAQNHERYALLKWAQHSFENFNIFPPGAGIIHQVNLEYIAHVIATNTTGAEGVAFPDSLIGTDSHTTMINGLGIVGWGVGGIEAEAVMLGQPLYMKIPEVVGMKLTGEMVAGTTSTDLVLTITQLLRKEKVVEKFVEFFGTGVKQLSLPDRAMIANMAPEYGATMGFFPIDEQTLAYLKATDRGALLELVETYSKEQGMFYYGNETPDYTKVLELDLSTIKPSLAGPYRPQDRINLEDMKTSFNETLKNVSIHGTKNGGKEVYINIDGEEVMLRDGSVVISAITSCTNTSNPAVLIGAGLMAKKAVEKGLTIQKHVKTSFAPGSRVVEAYLQNAGLMPYLEKLGYYIVGFGCTTCIGNSGPLHPAIEKAIVDNNMLVAAVLSGNRNFEARIHQRVKANYLASPLLVVAFGLAGRVDVDLTTEPLGLGADGVPVFLHDIWPSAAEIALLVNTVVTPALFKDKYKDILKGDKNWQNLQVTTGDTFAWEDHSTYIRRVPFLDGVQGTDTTARQDIIDARALLVLGDSVTTDHISPAGGIAAFYPAGLYLKNHGVEQKNFNSYGSRRGNHEVMKRGTFANIRLKNKLVTPKEGGYTLLFPEKKECFIYDAAIVYEDRGMPLIVLSGKEYGTGSSRDWAAKGSYLLGVKAVLAESYERIHRSNLIGMGVLPLEFLPGESMVSLGVTGEEVFSIFGITTVTPGSLVQVKAVKPDGNTLAFRVKARLDTEIEVEYYSHKGILPYVLREMIKNE